MGKHITLEQKYQIEAYFNAGYSQTEISLQLGKDKSIISREYRRNILKSGVYRAKSAQLFYEYARKPGRRKSKLSNEAMLSFVLSELKSEKSPEQITGITEDQLEAIQLKINTRERKRLGYLSPIQYLHINSLTKVAFRT